MVLLQQMSVLQRFITKSCSLERHRSTIFNRSGCSPENFRRSPSQADFRILAQCGFESSCLSTSHGGIYRQGIAFRLIETLRILFVPFPSLV
mmetsp:Transcript_10833/g.26020  ORF Transcript_10833/g.26020 Transcript_10833/m.26020 type:complete len:92 (-) Transcript_10833:72-347(-)